VETSQLLVEAVSEIEARLSGLSEAPRNMTYEGIADSKQWGRAFMTSETLRSFQGDEPRLIELVAVQAEYSEAAACMAYTVTINTTYAGESVGDSRSYFIEKYDDDDYYLAVAEGTPQLTETSLVYHAMDREMSLYDLDQLLRILDSLDPNSAKDIGELGEE